MRSCTARKRKRKRKRKRELLRINASHRREISGCTYLFSDISIDFFSSAFIPISDFQRLSLRKQSSCHVTISPHRPRRNFNNSSQKHWVNHGVVGRQATCSLLSLSLDTNNDGLVNWTDFEAAIEVIGPIGEKERNLDLSFFSPSSPKTKRRRTRD